MSDESQPTAAKVSWSGTEYLPLADGKYDVIILGTGLKESILSGLLSSKGMKVSAFFLSLPTPPASKRHTAGHELQC